MGWPKPHGPGSPMDLTRIARELSRSVSTLRFGPPVTHVYNPLEYAWDAHAEYLRRYGTAPREALLIGMNPGPFGMAQTGVPFGEVVAVRDWLGLEVPIGKPEKEHPKRPIQGFACPRSEVSGARLWGWARERFGTPERFFARFFIANYCPLVFMAGPTGRNVTPEKLPREEREPLFAACDLALARTVEQLRPRFVIGVGKFAEQKARQVLGAPEGITLGSVPHPSPASPLANQGWGPLMDAALGKLGVL